MQFSVNVLHANEKPFLTSTSNHMHHGKASDIDNVKAETLETGLQRLMGYYANRGFKVVVMLVDIQFKTLKNRNKMGAVMNIVS